jgi:hypothetical protein
MTHPVPGWRYVHTGVEGDEVLVSGIYPWQYQWQPLKGAIEVPHPSYPSQRHRLEVWRVATARGAVTFAAGEVSNGVWCFYEPDAAP